MGPVVKRIAQRVGHGARPGEKLFVGLRIPRAIAFGDTVGAHSTPFVVVTFEPDLIKVLETPITGYVFWRQMGVIVEDGLICRIGLI